ncbi:MAG TPA: hypothetical protein VKV21_01310 [Solirubrobacteraceae bacterium]|nr:hypothetical protein [Solirubrobacteraceae bacterium]
MSARPAAPAVASPPVARPRWELPALGALAVLSFVCFAITIKSAPGGLPAHPLLVHVPVILIPIAGFGALVLMARPQWLAGLGGPWIGLTAVVALGGLDLATNAGESLRTTLGLDNPAGGGVARIVSIHASLADQLRAMFILFTAVYLVTLAVHATADGSSSGVPFGDRIFARIRTLPGALIGLRLVTAVLAVLCLVWVYRVGDEGARAVWYVRLHAPPG